MAHRRTKEEIEKDCKIIWETMYENEEITSSAELVYQLAKKGLSLTWYQICYALGDKKEDLLSILKKRRTEKKDDANHEKTTKKNEDLKEYTDTDKIWTIDASVISSPKEMYELLKFLGSVPWIALTYVTLFEILKFKECTDRGDDMSRGANAFLDFYLENRNKFINIKSEKQTDLSQLSNTDRDDLLVKICKEKNLSLITSDRAMAAKAVFAGCEVNYVQKSASGGNSIPPLKKIGEEYYFRGTSTSEVKYSILGPDPSSVYPSTRKDTSSGYTAVNRGDYLYVAKKGFFAAYIIDIDWTYCLLYTLKFFNKHNIPESLTEYTL